VIARLLNPLWENARGHAFQRIELAIAPSPNVDCMALGCEGCAAGGGIDGL
jgi:hypothetical protein